MDGYPWPFPPSSLPLFRSNRARASILPRFGSSPFTPPSLVPPPLSLSLHRSFHVVIVTTRDSSTGRAGGVKGGKCLYRIVVCNALNRARLLCSCKSSQQRFQRGGRAGVTRRKSTSACFRAFSAADGAPKGGRAEGRPRSWAHLSFSGRGGGGSRHTRIPSVRPFGGVSFVLCLLALRNNLNGKGRERERAAEASEVVAERITADDVRMI